MLEAIMDFEFPIIWNRQGQDTIWMTQQLQLLQKVPNYMKKLLTDKGAYIVFFDGKLTDEPECIQLKNRVARRYSDTATLNYDDVEGLYAYAHKAIMVGKVAKKTPHRTTLLHELGHCVDFLLGERFYGENISDIARVKTLAKENSLLLYEDILRHPPYNFNEEQIAERKKKDIYRWPIEFFAQCFVLYYTDKSRLESVVPEMVGLLDTIDERASF